TFEDRLRLPYFDAVCQEVLRWRPVSPLAIPHADSEDDFYKGIFIPNTALFLCASIGNFFHDPATYPEPDVFRLKRFLNPDGSLCDDPLLSPAFGFGKCICPERHFVDADTF
ncbi:cytochrome P450, partial [Lactarius indigo]